MALCRQEDFAPRPDAEVIEGEIEQVKDLDGLIDEFHSTAHILGRLVASHRKEAQLLLTLRLRARAEDHTEFAATLQGEADRWRDAARAVLVAFQRGRPTLGRLGEHARPAMEMEGEVVAELDATYGPPAY